MSPASKQDRCLRREAGGPLNPTWVEWLMGFPIGWTAFEPLATESFQQWRDAHGRSSGYIGTAE